ncbi:MAG: fibronectin type III domain-containing protein [Armatimonadota bacterium]
MKEGWLVRLAILANLLALSLWTSMATAQTPPDLQNWTLRIEASATGVTADTDNTLGVAPTAVDGWRLGEDVLDSLIPPGNFVNLSFYHASSEPGWANHGGYYKTDLRAPLLIAEQKAWQARLRANLGTTATPVTVTLTWGDLSDLPAELGFSIQQVTATGEPIGDPVDMRAQPSLTSTFATNGTVETRIYNIVATDLRVGEPVVLSPVTVAGITANSITLEFTTDPEAIATVFYGPTTEYGSTVTETALATTHRVEITGLTPSTQYHLKVRAISPGRGAGESADLTATTLGLLTISGLQATNVSSTAATVTWTTNVAADATLRYGTDPANLGAPLTIPEAVTEHSIALAGLTPNTLYTVQVVSTAAGFAPAQGTFTFRTLPAITITAGPTVADVTGTSAVVSWTTDVPSSSVVQYGVAGATDQTAGDPAAVVTEHSVALTGLTPGTTYTFRVVSAAEGYDSAVSQESTFSTLPPIVASTPVVAAQPTSATISFTTNVAAVALLRYGEDALLDQHVTETAPATSHRFELTGLARSTTYGYKIVLTAEGMAETELSGTFTTPELQAIALVSGPTVTPGSTTAVITWTTDVACIGQVEVGPTTDYGITASEESAATEHSVTVTGLQKDTLYHFRIRAAAEGFTPLVGEDGTFRTLAIGFAESPAITDLTSTSAVIAFKTLMDSTAVVEYGRTDQYGQTVEVTEPATEFSVELMDLEPGTEYHYRVTITAGQESLQTGDATFVTLRKVAFTFKPRVLDLTRTSAVITFVTDVAAIGEVEYGTTTAYGKVKSDTAPVVQHRIELSGLTPGTQYHFKVRATAEGRDENATGDMVFTTLPLVVAGDIDGDGIVSENDALLALKFAVGLIELTESQIRAADVAPRGRPDGRITPADAVRLLRVAAGLELVHDQGDMSTY